MRNIEKLRNYFLGKDPQLKETMADNSLRLIGIPGKEYVLRIELLKRLGLLKKELTDKDEELQGLIDDLETALNGLAGDVTNLDTWKNDTDFVLANDLATALSDYYTKEQIDEIISVLPTFDIQVVEQLPAPIVAEQGVLYLVPSNDPGDVNYYDEYIVVTYQGAKSWEKVGSTAIDMSNYYTKSETDTLLNAKQGKLTPGTNITIDDNNVISATGGGGGTSDYNGLSNKPSINSVTLSGDKTTYDLLPQIPYTELPEPANPYVSIQDLVDAEGIYKTDITVTFTGGNWSGFPIHPNSIIKVSQHGSATKTVNVIIIDWDNIVECAGRLTVATDTWDNFEKKTFATTDEIPNITYSTTDLTPGTSTLADGEFYFVYE